MLLAALTPLARPTGAEDQRSGRSDAPTRWSNWPAARWRVAACPAPAGSARS
jgi:hypothetical protein